MSSSIPELPIVDREQESGGVAVEPTTKVRKLDDTKNDALFAKRVKLTRAKEKMPAEVLDAMADIRMLIADCEERVVTIVRNQPTGYDVGTLINFCARIDEAKDIACKSLILPQLD